MNAATTLFSEKGIDRTSSNEIARTAGVSIGTFYRYFSDKRELFLEILRDHLDSFVTAVYSPVKVGSLPLRDHIRDHIVKAFDAFDRNRDFHKRALVMKFADSDVGRLFLEVEDRQLVIITEMLHSYGKNPSNRDLACIAKIVHGAVENAAHAVKFLSSPMKVDTLIEELTEMIYRYIDSL